MEKKNNELIELSNADIMEINGGDGFTEDVVYIIGFSIKFNYNVIKWAYDSVTE